ncbi:MAG: hypothetical protein GWP09_01185, partial [Nitrospiraceae bacterium]|nr:hypothetical protein [Nitrospiraceae bacterium]
MKAKKPKRSQITKLNESLFVILTIVTIISTVFLFKGINNTNHMITGSISCTLCTNNTQPYPCNGSFENKNFTEGINETFTLCAKDDENDSIFFKLAQNSETWEDFTLYSNGTINVTPKKK